MKTEIFYALYLIAIVTEAMSGAIMGMQRGMDRFGLAFVGMVTALGGGTIRDVLFGRHPLVWIAHPEYLLLTLGAATLTSIIARHIHRLRMTFVTVDAIGLAAFTILGCDIGMTVSTSPVIVVLAGVLTGIGGGMLRDLLCGQVPLVLRREMYASVACIAGAMYVGMLHWGVDNGIATGIGFVAGFVIRMLAVWFGWRLRTFEDETPADPMH
ncbi:trimeric intracellular cation channel family protein [Pandoraea nosoerga]|uniref:Membrane protein n=1 Tax=Pandoraea nosoerga TaxID=2508296 RepID=A0A5E4W0U2_9BURK|nr:MULTISPECIES: trimeric intracellular cation channel family protein [Pandoraea]MBN4666243.1 trimeric intracellular cation channel family protein [Pandoraea nosoerga]MBN4676298.1 trimeric intracellular cation channel family protein [Pandoraea nosoerga]MBN4681335.1 trimeric intracellular cation channel family protein [Pandoraea nosoerga]MBN4745410.1 trimeric intracellular cation channel family protein [Pandoraea nosoerga]VVE17439.1 membrane protein [Pandoraea nosoerga]